MALDDLPLFLTKRKIILSAALDSFDISININWLVFLFGATLLICLGIYNAFITVSIESCQSVHAHTLPNTENLDNFKVKASVNITLTQKRNIISKWKSNHF